MGKNANVFLGSAELAAIVAIFNRIPTPAEYFDLYNKYIEPDKEEIYKYLQFDEDKNYDL
jgi:aconitate hydratase 2/2-methylisocitrate dehydratase